MPAGQDGNWVQTMPGKSWNVILRLYAPLQPWFDKSWKPGDFELVEQVERTTRSICVLPLAAPTPLCRGRCGQRPQGF